MDILYQAAPTGIGLDAHHALQLRRVHHTVVGKDATASAADLAAYDDAAMSVLHLAVAYDDVLAGALPEAAVIVASALDGDAVIAGVEVAVLYQHTVARLRVATVTVRPVIIDMYATHGDIGREQGVDDPKG